MGGHKKTSGKSGLRRRQRRAQRKTPTPPLREPGKIHQCKTCPWKVGADPYKIPNYVPELAAGLRRTIANARNPVQSVLPVLSGCGIRMMACHYSKPGEEIPCAGWLENQLGPGNNIGLRLLMIHGKVPVPVTEGEQHECYEDTLPEEIRNSTVDIDDYCDLED